MGTLDSFQCLKYPVTKIQFEAPRKVAVVTKAMDFALEALEAHDVLPKTRSSIVSTDTELSKLVGLQRVDYPFDLGNRAVGEVVAVGSEIQCRDGGWGFQLYASLEPYPDPSFASQNSG